MTKFTIFVPVLNGEEKILKTLNSIYEATILASKQCTVRVIILDGNSSDSTLEVALDWYSTISKSRNFQLDFYSESDSGMYHALSRHINKVEYGIVSYLNCGDLYENSVFVHLSRIFSDHEVNWVTGRNQHIDLNKTTSLMNIIVYRQKLIKLGVYGRFPFCPVIQQESTFWRAHLLKNLDLKAFSQFKLAGDFYLWFHLSSSCRLHSLNFPIASFVFHENRLSQNTRGYLHELNGIRERGFSIFYFILIIDLFCFKFRKPFLNHSHYVKN